MGVPRPAFPKTLREFQSMFASEVAGQKYRRQCRWPDGFVCPRCGNRSSYEIVKPQRWPCTRCRYQVSLTAGTILHNTKTPLTVWFWAAYLMTTDKRGVSALLWQRQLGLRRYETAGMLLHKLRPALVNLAREPRRGEGEGDDTGMGGTPAGWRGSRQLRGRKAALIVVAVEKRGRATGRARRAVIPDFRGATLIAFLRQNVATGSLVYPDALHRFTGWEEAGFRQVPRSQPSRTDLHQGAKSVVPWADRALGNRKQWWLGTHHGVGRDKLQAYLDEFVFRPNRRKPPRAAFPTLLGLGTGQKSTTYQEMRSRRTLPIRPAQANPNILELAETTG